MAAASAPTIEAYETPTIGSRVWFYERDAYGGRRHARKHKKHGYLRAIDGMTGSVRDVAQVQWLVPMRKIHRYAGEIAKAYGAAKRRHEYAMLYKDKTPWQRKALRTCARDSRELSQTLCAPGYTGPVTPQYLAEMRRCRETRMAKAGIHDHTDRGTCRALPLLLSDVMKRGTIPSLRGVDYLSVESGAIGPGDSVTLGGRRWCVSGFAGDNVILKSGRQTVSVPMERIPRQRGTRVGKCRAHGKLTVSLRRRATGIYARGKKHCLRMCICRSRRGRFAHGRRRR